MIVLDENGNLVIDGVRVERKDPLSYFSKDASIMHGRFGTYAITRHADPEVEANVLADEKDGVAPDVDPAFQAETAERLQFDRR